jgi:crossover junction endodeoxyribonuclease RuvC
MRIIGVDPGSAATGFGIVQKNGSASVHVHSGVIRPSKNAGHPKRLCEIYERLEKEIAEHGPRVMVVESLFHHANPQSLMKLCQVRGVILLAGERHGLEIYEYSPMEIKKGLTGYGRADKQQMIFMIQSLLSLKKLRSSDQADALAMALYHSNISWPDRVAL